MSRQLLSIAGVLFLSALASCESEQGLSHSAACQVGSANQCLCPGGELGTQTCTAGVFSPCQCGASAAANGLPCDVGAVMQSQCWQCHGSVPQFTAPMSLVSHADFMAPSPSDPTTSVYEQVRARVHHGTSPMPPMPNERLDEAQLATLDGWINAGVPASPVVSCPGVVGGSDATTPTNVGGEGAAGSGGGTGAGEVIADAPYDPTAAIPADQECYELRARADASGAPFNVGANTLDVYYNFTFSAPWDTTTPVQAVSLKAIIDNSKVIHHWLLYDSGPVQDGAVAVGTGAHGNDVLLAGWAPGASDTVMPADVGMLLGEGFTVEVHYNNPTLAPELDSSGVQVCLTRELRPNVAGLHWLGTEAIFSFAGGDVSGDCTPRTDMGPITIVKSWPHMHLKGTHFKTVINRTGGGQETLHDAPFDFNFQLGYDTPALINPGDTLTTTCTYNGAAMGGTKTSDEMCYNFVLAYPVGGLSSGNGGGPLGASGATSANRCLQ